MQSISVGSKKILKAKNILNLSQIEVAVSRCKNGGGYDRFPVVLHTVNCGSQ